MIARQPRSRPKVQKSCFNSVSFVAERWRFGRIWRIPSNQEETGELAVHVVSRPGTQIGVLGGFQVNHLCRLFVHKRFRGAKQGQGTVGRIDQRRERNRRRERRGEKRGIESITNEGVPYFENDIHDGQFHGYVGETELVEGMYLEQKKEETANNKLLRPVTPARNHHSR